MQAFVAGGKVASGRAIGDVGISKLAQISRQQHGIPVAPPPHMTHRRSGRRGQPLVLNVLNGNIQVSSFWPDDSPSVSPTPSTPTPNPAPAWSDAVQTDKDTNKVTGTDVEKLLRMVADGSLTPQDATLRVLEASTAAALGGWDNSGKNGEQLVEDSCAIMGLSNTQTSEFPEVVWAPGKTPEEVAACMRRIVEKGKLCMATRISPEVFEKLQRLVPGSRYHPRARICTFGGTARGLDEWGCNPEYLLPGSVVVLAAVT
eukprot:CAMPEP_0118946228 /NCGR_PEP_ID=MMETSP1169-20130426/43850_1 /TAXON_ID=36882 /ORGANISM="Pyramimonas obovata, Strain CCMP722" /LENGTH=258 /DNA_ID=CAMNT_0006892147 /DNA_START=161 /DNA_END=934 /DNA_ORIENTATION=+